MHYNAMQSKYIGHLLKSAIIIFMSCCLLIFSGELLAKQVKMSKSKICHDSSSPYYSRTKNFTAFETIEACLAAGGKLPKGSHNHNKNGVTKPANSTTSQSYSRSAFAHWTDDDGDCLNTRHELLQDLSTGPVTMSENGCRVLRGRWNDPYSGNVLFDSSKMDIDHLVPLAWAWEHGAYTWTDAEREKFANDPINLFAVTASLNRSKGAKGPSDWLPPNQGFHCQYVTRYLRVMLKYDFNEPARDSIRGLRKRVCG